MLKIFPYEIQRITGLKADWLSVQWISVEIIQALEEEEKKLEQRRDAVLQWLDKWLLTGTDYSLKVRLQQLYKDLRANRQPKSQKLRRFLHQRGVESEYESLLRLLEQLSSQQIRLQQARECFSENYRQAWGQAGRQLQEQTQQEDFLHALVLSSLSLYQRSEAFWSCLPEKWNKKQRQTAISLLQYLSRMTTKTSPYSRFTRLAARQLPEDRPLTAGAQIYPNTHLLPHLQDWLTAIPGFRSQMSIRLNPSTEFRTGSYRFVFNSKNVESVQRIETNELLDYLIEKLRGRPVPLEQVIRDLAELVDAELIAIQAYCLELIQLGLLEWDWQISALDSHWYLRLLELVKRKMNFTGQQDFIRVLESLASNCQQLLTANVAGRVQIIEETYQQFQELEKQVRPHFPETSESSPLAEVFHNLQLSKLAIPPEQLFFEDAVRAPLDAIPAAQLHDIIRAVDRLVRAVCPLATSRLQPKLLKFLQTNYPNGYEGTLLDVYEHFFRYYLEGEQKVEEADTSNETSDELQRWEDAIRRLGKRVGEGEIHLPLEALVDVSEDLFPFARIKGQWVGNALLQTFQADQTWMAYIDTVFSGYGKLGGRFLPLFPATVHQEIQQWNLGWQGQQLWVENSDASSFSANVHPPLLIAEICTPGSQQRLNSEQQIPVRDLGVRFKPPSKIELHREGQVISIFDLGFESWRSRSAMYRLLNCFSHPFPDWIWFRERLQAIYRGVGGRQDGHVLIPRITIGGCLVIQRQTWLFRVGQFPVPHRGETDTAYFLRVRQWQQENDLPVRGFVSLQSQPGGQGEARKRSDDYKPQYMDLLHPLFVRLLGQLTKRNVQQLRFTEVLPNMPKAQKEGVINLGIETIVEWGNEPRPQ